MGMVKTAVSWVLFLVGLYFVITAVAAGIELGIGVGMAGLPRSLTFGIEGMIGVSIGIHAAIGALLIYASRMSYFKH